MKGTVAYKLQISPRWKIPLGFRVSILESYQFSSRPTCEQPPPDPEHIEGDLEWEIERIVHREIISYKQKVCGRNKLLRDLRYFVKWKGCTEDQHTREAPEGRKNAEKELQRLQHESLEMPGPGELP